MAYIRLIEFTSGPTTPGDRQGYVPVAGGVWQGGEGAVSSASLNLMNCFQSCNVIFFVDRVYM